MNKIYKSVLSVSAAALIAGASLAPAAVFAYGDTTYDYYPNEGRPTYSIGEINAGDIDELITFNSIEDHGDYMQGHIQDERNFVGAMTKSGYDNGTASVWNANEIEAVDGETYKIRLYVHNNNPLGEEMIAEGVKATFSLPTTVGKEVTVIGYLDSTNATPDRYWDEVTFKSDDNFYLEYVEGSAVYKNHVGTFNLSDDLISESGAMLGYEQMDGRIPGCYDYEGEVLIEVKVHKSVSVKLAKTVRIKGSDADFTESVKAKVGDEVEYQIEFVNLLNEQVDNVMIRDILSDNMEYVEGSTYLFNSLYTDGVRLADDTVTTSGLNIGSYAPRGNALVRFTAKITNDTLACGNNQLVNWANVTVNNEVAGKDDASVFVVRNDDTCKELPSRLPETGPMTIATGALGAGAVTTVLGYAISSRKK